MESVYFRSYVVSEVMSALLSALKPGCVVYPMRNKMCFCTPLRGSVTLPSLCLVWLVCCFLRFCGRRYGPCCKIHLNWVIVVRRLKGPVHRVLPITVVRRSGASAGAMKQNIECLLVYRLMVQVCISVVIVQHGCKDEWSYQAKCGH